MMLFEEACDVLCDLLDKSQGSFITLQSGENYKFNLIKKYTLSELSNYEAQLNIRFPNEYKYFMRNVGASKIYIDEYGLGVEFYPINYLTEYSNEVFRGMENPFPDLFVIAANIGRGDVIGYDFSRGADHAKLATFSSEENPEKWLEENTSWSTFSEWLIKLVESEGEEDIVG